MKLTTVVNGAVGAFSHYCAGYLNPGASGLGYIAAVKLSAAAITCDSDEGLNPAYDMARGSDAYMGQINRMNSSSFCGLNGALWGCDLVKPDEFKNGKIKPLFVKKRRDGERVPVWDIQPILNALERLFGTDTQRRFPLLPGAMVPCAGQVVTARGPAVVRCITALAIAEDRENESDRVIHHAGLRDESAKTGFKSMSREELIEKTVFSLLRCENDRGVLYKEIFVGYKELKVREGETGCALSCMPYFTLAQQAVPPGSLPEALINMTVSQWENILKLPPFKKKK